MEEKVDEMEVELPEKDNDTSPDFVPQGKAVATCKEDKVDVEFRAVGRADKDTDGRVTLVEDSRDIIVKISRPYLQFAIGD